MQRIVTMVLGLIVLAVVAFSAISVGSSTDTPEVAEAPTVTEAPETGGPTPLAPEPAEPDPSESVPFIEGEPVYDLNSIRTYDQHGNLVLEPDTQP